MRRLTAAVAAALAACTSSPGSLHQSGDEQFLSPPPGPGTSSASAGTGVAPGTVDSGQGTSPAPARAIEEADIYQLDGTTLYVLNAWRGLEIVDLADLGAPRLLARVPLLGTPVDLYLRGGVAMVVSTDLVGAVPAGADSPVAQSVASQLAAVDVSTPSTPRVLAVMPIEGRLETTRIVGNVLYAVSHRYPYWFGFPVLVGGGGPVASTGVGVAAPAAPISTTTDDLVFVASFDITDPGAPRAVDRIDFPAQGWETHANVTADRITLAQSGWDSTGPVAVLRAIDSSDAGGKLQVGSTASISGRIPQRWAMDLDASGSFRVVVENGWNAGARFVSLAWPDPAAPAQELAEIPLDVPESLTAARFDGGLAYAVTAARIDPLWVIDARDPAAPVLAGKVEMAGQLDFIEPRGDRLLALGHTNEAGAPFQLQVSLLDVAKPSAPALLSRAIFGPDWAFVPASPDDLRKAFQVLDDQGLVLVPYQGFDRTSWEWRGGTQLVLFGRDAVQAAGFVPHAGAVRRAFAAGPAGKLAALSDRSLQTIDATDPAKPVELAAIDLARPVAALAIAGDLAVELSGDYWSGATELATAPAVDPDTPSPLGRLHLPTWSARLVAAGDTVFVLGGDPLTNAPFVASLDLTDPAAPRIAARVDLPSDAGWWWWSPDSFAQVGPTIAFLRTTWRCDTQCVASSELWTLDLSDPAAPRVAGSAVLPEGWPAGPLLVDGTDVWVSQYTWASSDRVRFEAARIDLSDPAAPVMRARLNVPGWLVGVQAGLLYTQETAWPATWPGEARTSLYALAPTDHGTARLLATTALVGVFDFRAFAGDHAYATGVLLSAQPGARLASVRLSDLSVASNAPVPGSWAWIRKAAGGKLFVSTAWPMPSLFVYGLADPDHPGLEQTVTTSGWVYDVVVDGGWAYLPLGWYGVARVQLAP